MRESLPEHGRDCSPISGQICPFTSTLTRFAETPQKLDMAISDNLSVPPRPAVEPEPV